MSDVREKLSQLPPASNSFKSLLVRQETNDKIFKKYRIDAIRECFTDKENKGKREKKNSATDVSFTGDLNHSMPQSIPLQFDTKLPTWGHYDEYDASNNLDLYPTVQLQRDRAWMRTLGIGKLCTGYFSGWLVGLIAISFYTC